jgi:hypothetical protein
VTSRHDLTVSDIASAHDEVLPHIGDQHLVFARLLDSISYCQGLGSSAWSLTLLDTGFRLNVGPVEAMTCTFTQWLAEEFEIEQDITFATLRLLLAGADCLERISSTEEHGEISEMNYRSVGEKCWCYSGVFHPATNEMSDPGRLVVKGHLCDNHLRFLKLACHTPTGKLRQRSNFEQHHCEALFAYAQRVGKGDQL